MVTILNCILDQPIVRLENWIKSHGKLHERRTALVCRVSDNGGPIFGGRLRKIWTALIVLIKPSLRHACWKELIIVEAYFGWYCWWSCSIARQTTGKTCLWAKRNTESTRLRVDGSIGASRTCISRHIRLRELDVIGNCGTGLNPQCAMLFPIQSHALFYTF